MELDRAARQLLVQVSQIQTAALCCPHCGHASPGYDHRVRRWRHFQYETILEAQVPRVRCPEHAVVTVQVPWADSDSGFTQLFEALVIDWLQEVSIQAVQRGLARREAVSPKR